MTYHEEQQARRQAIKINSLEEYQERIAEREMLYSTPYGDMNAVDDIQRFEDIRDLSVVIGDYEDFLKEERQKVLDNPQVGMFASRILHTDVDPYEIIKKNTEKKLTIRSMTAELDPTWKPETIVGGFAGHTVNNHSQKWVIESNENGVVVEIRKRKDGRWYDKHGTRFDIDTEPHKFYDYNF